MPHSPFPALRWDTSYNCSVSLQLLASKCRTEEVRVVSAGVDNTGKLEIRLDLPGSKTIRRDNPASRR